ncbi:hypothetical protein ACJ72_04161 [Emergomyces africanus]|uniref:Uncharacterized protein n=1 Tax=Emergomyces africanus TaxID=1955775 RepID=A0A1B7NXM5_9EURO|nr:hypothetical protein ACJ72_04161 [Emergomyces africanus]
MSGRVEDCPLFTLQSQEKQEQCKLRLPKVLTHEQCQIHNGLPGNVSILRGPAAEDKENIYKRGQLSLAVDKEPVSKIIKLMNDKNKIEETDTKGRTALSWAAEWGFLDVVELLLNSGAEIDNVALDGRSSLSWAAESGSLVVVKLLVERGANVNLKDMEGSAPLGYSYWCGRVVSLLSWKIWRETHRIKGLNVDCFRCRFRFLKLGALK